MDEGAHELPGGISGRLIAGAGAESGLEEGSGEASRAVLEGVLSLDAPIGEWGGTLGDIIVDSASEPQPDEVDVHELRERLSEALDELPEPERRAMSLRFGQEDGRPRTLSEVGDELGMEPIRVRQIESGLIGRLRGHQCGKQLEDLLSD